MQTDVQAAGEDSKWYRATIFASSSVQSAPMKSGASASNAMTSATHVVRAADVRHAGVTSKLNNRYSTMRAIV